MESSFGIISWIIFGTLAGWVASLIAGTAPQSLPDHVLVGIIGALAGAALAHVLGTPQLTSGGSRYELVAAGDGALVLMTFWRLIRHR
jgi:uncharacterized membrane protein YeaQ/YmgE (transglycosylase-associated protein family)